MCDVIVNFRYLRIIILVAMAGTIVGCGLFGQQPIPDWIEGNSQHYPSEQYLVGRGEAESRDVAEQRAYTAVARIFHAKVKAQMQDSEIYTQVDREDETTTSRQLKLDHLTQISTDKILEDVQILETWHEPDKDRHFALAGLERAKTERMLLGRISTYDQAIHMNMKDGHEGKDVLTKLRGLKRALRTLQLRREANADLQIVRVTGEGVPAPYSIAKIQRELNTYLLKDVRIDVRITGDQRVQVRKAVWDGLNQEGFVTLEEHQHDSTQIDTDSILHHGNPDLLVTGTTRLDDLKLFDPLFKYVRWCSDLQIIESNRQRVIGVVSRSGREGHITQEEARVRATRAMQKVVSTEIAKSLAHYIYDDDHEEVSFSSSCLPQE